MNLKNVLMAAVASAVFAGTATPASAQHRGGGGHAAGGGVRAAPRGAVVAPVRFVRPYYAFRPRVVLGFGLIVGYPVAYPLFYGYPYPVPYPYAVPYPYPYAGAYPAYGYPAPVYPYGPPAPYAGQPSSGYPPPESVNVQPGAVASGGISLEISPDTAEVFVDGTCVGVAMNFGPTYEPLTLAPGRHHVEVRAPGHEILAFETDVTAGQVIPYRGTMKPQQ